VLEKDNLLFDSQMFYDDELKPHDKKQYIQNLIEDFIRSEIEKYINDQKSQFNYT
jgi:hypothetical protein